MNGNWLFKCELMTKEMGEFLTEAIVWLIFNFFLHHITVNTIRFRNSTYVLKHESEFEIRAFISWLLPFDNEHNKPCLLDVIILFAGKKKSLTELGSVSRDSTNKNFLVSVTASDTSFARIISNELIFWPWPMAIWRDRFHIADKPWRKATSREHLALQFTTWRITKKNKTKQKLTLERWLNCFSFDKLFSVKWKRRLFKNIHHFVMNEMTNIFSYRYLLCFPLRHIPHCEPACQALLWSKRPWRCLIGTRRLLGTRKFN